MGKEERILVKAERFSSVTHTVIDEYAARIGTTALAVYVVLQRFADWNTGEAYPSRQRVCSLLNISVNTLRTAIRKLTDEKLLVEEAKQGEVSTFYVLTPSKIDRVHPVKNCDTPCQKLTLNNNQLTRDSKYMLHENQAREIYMLYPRLIGMRKAVEAIQKAHRRLLEGESGRKMNPTEAFDYLRIKAMNFKGNTASKEQEFIPYPATWFNQSRYLDGEQRVSSETASLFEPTKTSSAAAAPLSAVEKVRRQLRGEN